MDDSVSQWAVPTDSAETADGAVACVLGFFDAPRPQSRAHRKGRARRHRPARERSLADGAIIASVTPCPHRRVSDVARRLTDARPLTVGPGLKTGLKMNFSDPTAVGADRVAEMVGAKSTYGAPALVIDLGTSTTFELLDEVRRAFRGGIIAPGMKLGAQALARGAAQLAAVNQAPIAARPHHAEAMQAAHRHGRGGPHRRTHRHGSGPIAAIPRRVVLVGQHAEAIAALMTHAVTVDQTLALRGLLELYTITKK
ncbi:MAG: type III pantothenate kinase [Adlercreutzia equolifaciens]